MRQVRDSSRNNVSTPTIFDSKRDTKRDAHVSHLTRLCDSAKLADLDVHNVHRQVALGVKKHLKRVDVLIQNEWVVRVSPD